MRRRLAAAFCALFLWAFLNVEPAAAAQTTTLPADAAIAVSGNRRTDAAMIRAQFRAAARKSGRSWLNAAALDAALKRLYATNLFADVKISRAGGRILVTVVENPTIARVAFEGDRKIKDDDLKKVVQSNAGGPLSRALVHGDVEHIVELYRQHGYFEAHIQPQTINAGNGRVDLVFAIKEGKRLAVRKILFVGNNAFSANRLEGVIKTSETNFLSFLLNNDIYNADRVNNDGELLRRFYLARGYADVSVHSLASYEPAKKAVVVTFAIDEGPRYRLGKVEIDSDLKNVDAASLRPYLLTPEGAIYDADAVKKSVEDATLALARDGHPFAAVLARSERVSSAHTEKTGVINLVYAVEEDGRRYVERIEIHGNTKTRDEVIRREFDAVEGAPYNSVLIERAKRRLEALGYFKSVRIETRPGSALDRVIIDVTVEEQQTGTFNISGGYGTATGMLAEVSIGDRNFLGTGDIAKASVTYGQYIRGADLSFTDPHAFGQRLSLGGALYGNETLAGSYQSFDSTVYGARLVAGTPLNDQLGVEWRYSIYNQSLSLDPAEGTASLPVQLAAAAGPMWVSSIGTGFTYSTLDDLKNPQNGVSATVSTELAGLGGAVKFARTSDDVRYYHQIFGDVVGMVRVQGGYESPWGGQELPLLDNFFGGPQLIRGFAPNGFGPRDITPGTTQDNVGGNVYWATSAELQAPMPLVSADARLKVALFADAGSLWANSASSLSDLSSLSPSQEIANSRALRASIGAGIIWDSMFGPIEVDYAYLVAKQSYDVTQRLYFTAGAF